MEENDNLDDLVKKLARIVDTMNEDGLDIFFRDKSKSAGYRYGFTRYLLTMAIGGAYFIDVSDDKKLQKCRTALSVAEAYLSEDRSVLPEDFVPPIIQEFRVFTEPDPNNLLYLMRNNVYLVLENLNKHAKYFVEQHRIENRAYHFEGTFRQIQSALALGMQKDIATETKVVSLLSALNNAYDYALFVLGMRPDFFERPDSHAAKENIRKLFEGYEAGHRDSLGRYTLDANEMFSKTKERFVLYAQIQAK